MNIGHEIALLRNEKKMSQKKLAAELNISNGLVGLWESGKRIPSLDMLVSIADYFQVSIDYLLQNDRNVSPEQFVRNAEADESTTLLLQTFNNLSEANRYILLGKALELLKEESKASEPSPSATQEKRA